MNVSSPRATLQVTDNGSTIVINTGAGLIYTVNKSNGDITSCTFNGTELVGTKPSHINSGLGSSGTTVSWSTTDSDNTIIISSETDTLTHYYVSRGGENNIYMATYITAEPSVGELRYIFRGNGSVLVNVPPYSDIRDNVGAVESSDVFALESGYTVSKYYGNDQAKDLTIRGATGSGVGVFMAYGCRESSSGGPFFRDIQFQSGTNTEIYNYMNSGHNQTEDRRMGLNGPYALCFTSGAAPDVPALAWMSSLGLTGWVDDRGKVVLNGLSGMKSGYTYLIGFANETAQYWVSTTSTGSAVRDGIKPGTYTMTVYKNELAVYSEDVTVTANSVTTVHTRTINDPADTEVIWRIGVWDGTPLEFLNGGNLQYWHPSDQRNDSWVIESFAAGGDAGTFPAVQFRQINSTITITFDLTEEQAAAAHTLNIGITGAYIGGRPDVSINGYSLTILSPSSQPSSRSFTIGTYRGNNATFAWSIPASRFVTGSNTISFSPASGSSDLGGYLSAAYAFDCIELTA